MLRHQMIHLLIGMLHCNDDPIICTGIRVLEELAQYGVLFFKSVFLLLTGLADDAREAMRISDVIPELTDIRDVNQSWLTKRAGSALEKLMCTSNM